MMIQDLRPRPSTPTSTRTTIADDDSQDVAVARGHRHPPRRRVRRALVLVLKRHHVWAARNSARVGMAA